MDRLAIDPSFIVGRIKGRIDHRFRSQKIPLKFSRKVSLRALGNNTTADVLDYIRRQVDSAQFCRSDFADNLKQFTRVWQDEKLHAPMSWSSKVGVESATSSFWGTCLKSAKRSRWNVIIS